MIGLGQPVKSLDRVAWQADPNYLTSSKDKLGNILARDEFESRSSLVFHCNNYNSSGNYASNNVDPFKSAAIPLLASGTNCY